MQTLYLAKPETREAMRQYIDRTGISGGKFERYSLKAPEIKVLYEMFRDAEPVEAVIFAFMYGASKGYRFAKRR